MTRLAVTIGTKTQHALMQINAGPAGRMLELSSRAEPIGDRGMNQISNGKQVYLCPMHSDVRRPSPGKCPKCGMNLVREGTRFALLRHMISSPLHLVLMAAVMAAAMAAAMMMMR